MRQLAGRTDVVARNPRIVEGAVEPTVGGDHLAHHRADLGALSHVGLHEHGLAAGRVDGGDGFLRDRLGRVRHRDPRALTRHRQRRRASDAAAAARHQRDAPVQDTRHCCPPSLIGNLLTGSLARAASKGEGAAFAPRLRTNT